MIENFLKIKTAQKAEIFNRGYVLNIDSGWGFGKTFFLTRLQKQLKSAGHIAVYVNGWLDDSSSEPMISVISEIEKEIAPHLKKSKALAGVWRTAKAATGEIALAVAKGAIKRVSQKYLSDAVDEIVKIHDNINTVSLVKETDESDPDGVDKDSAEAIENILDRFISTQIESYRGKVTSMETFKKNVSKLIENLSKSGKPLPMFILVDELDRCRPTYSIMMLEAIKHIFDIPNVAFIISTDSTQLSKSIKAVYGGEFDSETYLRRFFDRTYRFDEPSHLEYSRFLIDTLKIDTKNFYCPPGIEIEEVFAGASRHFSLSMRDMEHCFDNIATFTAIWTHKAKINLIYMIACVFLQYKSPFGDFARFVDGSSTGLPGTGQWQIRRVIQRHGDRPREEKIDIVSLVSSFRGQLKAALPDICNKEWPDGEYNQWVRRYFHEEFNAEYEGRYSLSAPPKSLLDQYPAYVRMLSNLN